MVANGGHYAIIQPFASSETENTQLPFVLRNHFWNTQVALRKLYRLILKQSWRIALQALDKSMDQEIYSDIMDKIDRRIRLYELGLTYSQNIVQTSHVLYREACSAQNPKGVIPEKACVYEWVSGKDFDLMVEKSTGLDSSPVMLASEQIYPLPQFWREYGHMPVSAEEITGYTDIEYRDTSPRQIHWSVFIYEEGLRQSVLKEYCPQ
jgi:hypothetical protein